MSTPKSAYRSTDSSSVLSEATKSLTSTKRTTPDSEREEIIALPLATRADIESLFEELRHHVNQVKHDLIFEQRRTWKTFGAFSGSSIPVDDNTNLSSSEYCGTQSMSSALSMNKFRKKKAPNGPRRLSNRGVVNVHSGIPVNGEETQASSENQVREIASERSHNRSSNRNSGSGGAFSLFGRVLSKSTSRASTLDPAKEIRKEELKRRNSRFGREAIQQNTNIYARREPDEVPVEHAKADEGRFVKREISRVVKQKRRLDMFVLSPIFDAICGLLILFNAVLTGAETEIIAQGGEDDRSIEMMQHVLNAWYLFEICLRLSAQGWGFFNGEDRNWNIFDSGLVASAIVDLVLTSIGGSFKTARVLRVLRVFRIVRTLRIIRQFKYVREFRKMVCSLMASLQTLLWSLILVFGVMYTFALWFTQSAADLRKDNAGNPDMQELILEIDGYYNSFSRSVFSLFAAISGGYSWHVLVDPWIAAEENMSVIFFFSYISAAVFGLMNIVTSVFVESAMHATKHFQDLLVDEKKKDLEMYMTHMETIFHVIDEDGGGTISFEEMAAFLEDAGSELPQYLEALGITSKDVWVLFKLLDTGDTGSIDIKEFCEGCMRLKGEARSFDINCMMYENRAMIKYQADFMEFVEEQFELLERQCAHLVDAIDKRFAVRMAGVNAKMKTLSQPVVKPTLSQPASEALKSVGTIGSLASYADGLKSQKSLTSMVSSSDDCGSGRVSFGPITSCTPYSSSFEPIHSGRRLI